MPIFKNEVTRFFALGFVGGTALLLAAMGLSAAHDLADGIVAPASAATTN